MFDEFAGRSRPNRGGHTVPASDAEERLADRDVRLLAWLFDRSLWVVTVVPPVLFLALAPAEASSGDVMATANLASGLAGLGLLVTQWALLTRRGQSIGKIALGIRIERPDGSLPDFVRVVILRDWILGIFTTLGVLVLVDALFIFGDDRRTLHDRIADTRVVRAGHA